MSATRACWKSLWVRRVITSVSCLQPRDLLPENTSHLLIPLRGENTISIAWSVERRNGTILRQISKRLESLCYIYSAIQQMYTEARRQDVYTHALAHAWTHTHPLSLTNTHTTPTLSHTHTHEYQILNKTVIPGVSCILTPPSLMLTALLVLVLFGNMILAKARRKYVKDDRRVITWKCN